MLKQLRLTNFRRHQDRVVVFSAGLNVIRGENEAGKSTIEEALLYAFFGTRLLRSPLEAVVTWGCEVKTLRVELDFSSGHTVYTFRRSKSGAEVLIGSDVHVTGQAEVTAFATNLLGVDAKLAQVLMFAGQDSLRGALEDGPTAVSGLIGRLADFDEIDKLMRRGEETLSTGPDKVLVDRLRQAEESLAQARADLVPQATLDTLIAEAERLKTASASALNDEGEARQAAQEAARRHELVAQAHREHELRAAGLPVMRQRLSDLELEVTREREALAAPGPSPADLVSAEHSVSQALQAETQHKLWRALRDACAKVNEDDTFIGDRPGLDAEILRAGQEVARLRAEAASYVGEARGLRRLDGSKCPTCGAERVDAAHVERHNAAIVVREKELADSAKNAEGSAREFAEYEAALRAARSLDLAISNALCDLDPLGDEVVSDCTRVPRLVTLPPEPTLQPVEELRQRVRDITRQRVQREEAEGRLNRALQQIGYTQADLQAAELILGTASLPDLQGSKAELAVLQSQSDAAHRQWRELHDKCTDAQRQADLVQSKFAAALSTEASASKRITDIRADLDALAFGNGLMKKLRLLKPTVTDHLWSLTLTTVSAYFGQIRGETSIVTKDSSGFQVNGEPLSSYSGSTKDALAIAIRAALTKTFLPGAAFMTLDEPAHGASEDRTGRILAFLAHVGIDQVVIASHDPLSESVADNLIYL